MDAVKDAIADGGTRIMSKKTSRLICGALLFVAVAISMTSAQAETPAAPYPRTPKVVVADTLHGVVVADPYRWLEDSGDPGVAAWQTSQDSLTRAFLDAMPQWAPLLRRLNQLSRYDDESIPDPVLNGSRIFYSSKKKDEEKWVFNYKENPAAPGQSLIDPNRWPVDETLAGAYVSWDGKYVAFGKARGGNEHPVISVMEVDTRRVLPDSLRGWQQGAVSWVPDNSGFYYRAKPRKGEVPAGEEEYWGSVWYHRLGDPAEKDRKVFYSEAEKELHHYAWVTEDGKYVVYHRGRFNKSEVYFGKVGSFDPPQPLVTGFDAEYSVSFIDGRFFIRTDRDAPMYKIFVASVDHPERSSWKEFIPEDPKNKLTYIWGIGRHLYVGYEHNAFTRIKILDADGRYIRDFPFPAPGDGSVTGYWSKPEVWAGFSSFTYPETSYRYDFDSSRLEVYRKYPVPIALDNYVTEQVWYPSADSTQISMFLVHRADVRKDGQNPVLLTGYGGFNASMKPYFSPSICAWLEAGGMFAMPNLRGGGEYGKDWHEAGMREKKQNVFDDFIGAAEYLIRAGYSSPEHLVIYGGSNGGLLVGAAEVQRPDLFRAVVCSVPLLDMVRYHKFGYANIWSEEYGSAEDAAQFPYLYKYSPYHRVVDGTHYPTTLLIGSENDARVDPLHARKMAARLQAADPAGEPILLTVRKASGHGGGTTQAVKLAQRADEYGFLMHALGMTAPEGW
jgi:prolyl oligopeptidase